MNADANSMMDDPNKMMTPEDIAKLLASMEADESNAEPAVNVESATSKEPVVQASTSEEKPVIDMDDPNKMMTPEDIEKLLAAMATEDGEGGNEIDANVNSDGVTGSGLEDVDFDDLSFDEQNEDLVFNSDLAKKEISERNAEPEHSIEPEQSIVQSVAPEQVSEPEHSIEPEQTAEPLADAEPLQDIISEQMAVPQQATEAERIAIPNQITEAQQITEFDQVAVPEKEIAIDSAVATKADKPKKIFQKPKMRLEANAVPTSKEICIIQKELHIEGNITTSGNMEIYGTIEGDINVAGKLTIHGKVEGVAQANEIFIDNARYQGMLLATNTVKVGPSAVILGDITGKSAVIAGAIKGDIDVYGPVVVDSKAVIKGNIKSETIQINNGAIIDGNCVQCYGTKNAQSFFDKIENEE